MPILEGERVTRYFGGLAALLDVDFYVQEGEVLGLIGPNGAGKTTLFNVISAALAPMSGSIRFRGEEITGLKPYEICRRGIGRTFQTIKIFPDMTVMDNVVLGAFFGTSGKVTREEAVGRALEDVEFVGLLSVKDVLARDLTLANQKRLEVARALATAPEVLLLDEIMEGLNPTEVERAMELVRRIQSKGVTVIMIEHVMQAIMNVCGRIVVLHHGQKIAEGSPEEISLSKKVIEVYLGE
ncbi:MAG: ABC transporter ATP-binding protein [Deltaproteobacteria bacterium]